MNHHVIYIPGIGDHKSYGQDIAIKLWRIFGLHSHYLPLGWANPEKFSTKLARLTGEIDRLTEKGHTVSLVGTSAGASAVIAAYTARPNIKGIATIAGKIHHPETIGKRTAEQNPDFIEAAQAISANLDILQKRGDIKNILCIFAEQDKTVPMQDAVIEGASMHHVPGWDHSSGIFFGVMLGGRTLARFLKTRTV